MTCQETCSNTWYPSVKANYNVSVKTSPYSWLDICLSETCSQTRWFGTPGLALGVLYSFRFDFFTFGNIYGRLIRRKDLLIPFVSISLFFCRSNWLTKVDLSNRKTALHKLSTFSAASITALVRPRASSYRFFVL